MRVLLLLTMWISAVTASAQVADFRPLSVGDEWVFWTFWGTRDPFVTNYSAPGVQQFLVTGDTLVDGMNYHIVEVSSVSDGMATPVCSVGLRYDVNGVAAVVPRTGLPTALSCVRSFTFYMPPGSVTTHSPGTFLVGNTPTTFPVVRQMRETGVMDDGRPFERDTYFATGVGLIAAGHVEAYRTNAVAFSRRLVYARVSGVTYGSNPVSGESIPEGSVGLAVSAYPNPARGVLNVSVALPEATSVRLEAFDALGRRVAEVDRALPAGTAEVRLDASAWAPGVYVVRAVTDRGASRALRVIRAE